MEIEKNVKICKKLDEIDKIIIKTKFNNASLMGFDGGIILYLFYRYKQTGNNKFYNDAFKKLELLISNINQNVNTSTFANGLAGIGWLIEHLKEFGFIEVNTSDLFKTSDLILYNKMNSDLEKRNYDFLHGAAGYALYFIKRSASSKNCSSIIEDFLLGIRSIAIQDDNSLKWISKLRIDQELYGYNLSLSHGIASLIALFSKIKSINFNSKLIDELLNGSISYLLSNILEKKKYNSYFPDWISDYTELNSSRLAWCYGDIGIGMVLYNYSKIVNNAEVKKLSLNILANTTKRKEQNDTLVNDACFCHGTSGLMHIYGKLYTETKDILFADAKYFWLNQTLEMAKFEDGLAGYKTWHTIERGGMTNCYGLLEGIAGIGLALISAVSGIEPTWDECLLLS